MQRKSEREREKVKQREGEGRKIGFAGGGRSWQKENEEGGRRSRGVTQTPKGNERRRGAT